MTLKVDKDLDHLFKELETSLIVLFGGINETTNLLDNNLHYLKYYKQ